MTHAEALDLAPGFVLGALEPAEEAAVRDHLATCPEPHPEIAAFGEVVPALLEFGDVELVEPPASLGARILTAAAADLAANPRLTATLPGAAERATRADVRGASTSRLDWVLRVAAVIAIVASGTYALGLQGRLDAAQRFDRSVASVIEAAGQPGAKTVVLSAGKDSHASGIAAVASDGSVILAMRDLPATTGSQVYETWVIVGQAAPVAVGGFTVDANGTASFRTRPAATPAGAVIALTLEPREGNTAPTGPIVAAGIASAPPAQSS